MDNSLKNMFYRLINEYANLYAEVNRTQNYRHPFGSFIRNDIPNEIRRKGDIDQSKYIVKEVMVQGGGLLFRGLQYLTEG